MNSPVFHWYLPTSGDGIDVADQARSRMSSGRGRRPTLDYLTQVAGAADRLGYEGVLTPTGTMSEDPWIASAGLIPSTQSLKYLVALRPGLTSPTLVAQMAATFQRMSGGRVGLQIVAGSSEGEQRQFGDWLDHDARYARMDEFLTVVRGAWSGEGFDFEGDHYKVAGANAALPPELRPTIYAGGASPAAEAVAAKHADVYLMFLEPMEAIAERITRMRELAERAGRTLRFGLRMPVISRETSEEAWAEANRLVDNMDDVSIRFAQRRLRRMSAVGQRRQLDLHGGSKDNLNVAPNMWAGVGLLRGHAGTSLVGSHAEIAERLLELTELGCEEYILSGYPHLEEAYRVAEGVLPLVREGVAEHSAMSAETAPADPIVVDPMPADPFVTPVTIEQELAAVTA